MLDSMEFKRDWKKVNLTTKILEDGFRVLGCASRFQLSPKKAKNEILLTAVRISWLFLTAHCLDAGREGKTLNEIADQWLATLFFKPAQKILAIL